MESVYVVVENGEVYPAVYSTYLLAKTAVMTTHREELEEQEREAAAENLESASDVDVPESSTGVTQLYIEKGIQIFIHKLPVVKAGGGPKANRRSRGRYRRTRSGGR